MTQQQCKDLSPDLRSHILKIQKKHQLVAQLQEQPVKISTSTSTETSVPPPIYTSCVAGVTTTASTKSEPLQPSQESPQPIKSLESGAKGIPISSAPVMEMFKGIGTNQIGSSRVVLVKAQGQNAMIQDGRKPIMILKQKGKIVLHLPATYFIFFFGKIRG